MEPVSTRVNSARLGDYVGKVVRLTGNALRVNADTATIQASDGGEVVIQLLRDSPISETYIEVIGNVIDASTVKMMACINLGADLDMKLVNDAIELIHEPRFYNKMFTP